MASNSLNVGDKIEIKSLKSSEEEMKENGCEINISMIYDIKENGDLEIAMPIANGKMILLTEGISYELVFFSKGGLYRSLGKVKERYKKDNLYMLLIELKSPVQKHQRREYYRFPCSMPIQFYLLTPEEEQMEDTMKVFLHHTEKYQTDTTIEGIALDISGGGIRFISDEKMEENQQLLLFLNLPDEKKEEECLIVGKIISIDKTESDFLKYEYRVQFLFLEPQKREDIIKFIFKEERKQIKRT